MGGRAATQPERVAAAHAAEPGVEPGEGHAAAVEAVSYTHLRAHETVLDLVCRLLLEKKKNITLTLSACLETTICTIYVAHIH